ncbi:alpha/beta fold hydrolase [Modestobacter sp. VKM Ac-2978]|uniref:alpha/beta fold hydrolase n=1 Tax=Modestobacter sp. VKM Ac-2978 TaxID=3004132 RepID=UPI0022AA8B7C|nr:alpha/beta fold hydrolase [Modestobacter sp. VKM Ac-2978]MCZ2847905.1 alpha/beta fold hydrolase [Modestobacter sp. VKM Ac-2978]
MELDRTFDWRGRQVRWTRSGTGPAVVFCHGTPWSSWLWAPYADALAAHFTVHLWDMPGYGASSKDPEHAVSLDVQGQLFADLLQHWDLDLALDTAPHVIAHDFGGAVALRAHLLHGARYTSLALVDVVALAPWGSPFFRLVHDHADVFAALPPAVHAGAVRAYIASASHRGLSASQLDALVEPWTGPEGQSAFYRQIAQADEAFTDVLEPRYPALDLPVHVIWGREDSWIPADRAHRLADAIPGAQLTLVPDAGHLVQLDQPVHLATTLRAWLTAQA